MTAPANLIGHVFSRLTVSEAIRDVNGRLKWRCLCLCGNTLVTSTSELNAGGTKSCGCLKRDNNRKRLTTHGYAFHAIGINKKIATIPEYSVWNNMKQRCENKNHTSYHHYGERGITVCQRWRYSFENFINDMGRRPSGYILDRIDVNGNYEPVNCRWVSAKVSTENRRVVIWLEYNGVRLTISDWAKQLGVPASRLRNRQRQGLPTEEILFKPPASKRSP